MPFLLSIVGKPDSGKTTFILKLLPELEKKGYKVAVAKHCPHGFDLDHRGKDSWRFAKAGGKGIFLTSDKTLALLRPREGTVDIKGALQDYFSDFDIVLMEGYNNEPGIKRIEIIRRGIGKMGSNPDEIIAYISDMEVEVDKPVYEINDLSKIVDAIEDSLTAIR